MCCLVRFGSRRELDVTTCKKQTLMLHENLAILNCSEYIATPDRNVAHCPGEILPAIEVLHIVIEVLTEMLHIASDTYCMLHIASESLTLHIASETQIAKPVRGGR